MLFSLLNKMDSVVNFYINYLISLLKLTERLPVNHSEKLYTPSLADASYAARLVCNFTLV